MEFENHYLLAILATTTAVLPVVVDQFLNLPKPGETLSHLACSIGQFIMGAEHFTQRALEPGILFPSDTQYSVATILLLGGSNSVALRK